MPTHERILPSEARQVHEMPNHTLQATLQGFSRYGVQVRHFDRLRTIDEERLKRTARYIIYGGYPMTYSEHRGIDNLSSHERFMIADESARIFGRPDIAFGEKWVPYTNDTLVKCYMENMDGSADWRMVFLQDLTPRQIFDAYPERFSDAPNHTVRGDSPEAEKFTARHIFGRWEKDHVPTGVRGYHLVDCKERFFLDATDHNVTWDQQAAFIASLAGKIAVPPTAMLEVWLAYHKLTGRENFVDGIVNQYQACLGVHGHTAIWLRGFNASGRQFDVRHTEAGNRALRGTMVMKLPDRVV